MKQTAIGQCSALFDTGIMLTNSSLTSASVGTLHLINGTTHLEFPYTLKTAEIRPVMLSSLISAIPAANKFESYQMFTTGDIQATGCWCNAGTNNFFYGFVVPAWS